MEIFAFALKKLETIKQSGKSIHHEDGNPFIVASSKISEKERR
jgi:hypothetical protein